MSLKVLIEFMDLEVYQNVSVHKWKNHVDVYLFCSCMQRAKYDIGEEAVHRFSLSAEDRVTLELAEWVDSAFRKASV